MSTLVLVPSQLRAARATRRLCDAEGGVLFGTRAVTPQQLVPRLLAATRDPRPLLTPLAARLVAFEAARSCGLLTAEQRVESGAARALASALAELRAAEVPAASLEEAAQRVSGGAAERLRGAAGLLAAYEKRLAELGALDAAASLAAGAEAIDRGARSEDVAQLGLLVVDGFATMSAAEWRLVAALARVARRTHARVPLFPERHDVAAAEPLLRAFEGLHASTRGDVDVRLEHLDGERAGPLTTALLSIAGGPGGEAAEAADEVVAIAGAGEEGEAAAAARHAARWIDAGMLPEEILLFAPAPRVAAPRLARAFAELGIPFAGGVGEPLGEVPAVAVVRRALGAAANGLDRPALEALLSSTYLSVARPPGRLRDLLDRAGALDGRDDAEAVLRRRAAGLRRGARDRELFAAAADAIADLGQRLAVLRGPGLARDHATRVRALVDGGVRRRAARGEPVLAQRDVAALARLDECCDAVVTALALVGRGGAVLDAREWASLVELAVADAAAPAADPAGGAVELWSMSDAPGASCRAAILVGCERGAFPPAPPPAELLRDAERAAVNAVLRRGALTISGRERAAALHAAFCALAAPRDAVALTWAAPGAGHEGTAPAPLVAEVLAAVGRRVPAGAPGAPGLAEATSAREAIAAGARLAAAGRAAEARVALADAAPLAARLEAAASRGGIERSRREALAARSPAPFAGQLAPGPLLESALPAEWTPSQLETDARCPFRFFLETPCRLAAPDEALLDVAPRDEGKVLHLVLERFLGARIARGAPPLEDDEEARAELRETALTVFREMETTGRLGDPSLWPARQELILARLDRVLAAESGIAADDGLQPALLEHAFGDESALVFSDGSREARLRGRIDRIDASPDRLRVVDWKSGRANPSAWRDKVDPDQFGVTSFQLPAYLMAAARALPDRASLEAAYVFLRSACRGATYAADAGDPQLATAPEARAQLRDEGGRAFPDAVLDVVERIHAGRFPIAPRDCSGCGFGAVCRAEGSEEDDA